MLSYIVRRTLYMIPILIGITLLTFLIFNVLGGDVAGRLAGRHATPEQVASIKHELGLDKSIPEQYINYLHQIATFDYGRSWSTKQEVSTMLSEGVTPTLSMTIPPFLASIVFCIGLALFAVYLPARFSIKASLSLV